MGGSVLEGWPSLLNWIGGSYIIFIAKTFSKKIGALIRFMKFVSPEVDLYLYKSSIRLCMEYCYVWADPSSCYLEFVDKLQKRICRTVGPSLASSLEPLGHCWNVASLSLFYRYHFGRCSSELAQLVPLPFSWGRSTHYSDILHGFSVTIPKDVYVSSFFPHIVRLWNSLAIECFLLTYNLNGCKSRINSRFFQKRFPVYFNFNHFVFLFLFLLTSQHFSHSLVVSKYITLICIKPCYDHLMKAIEEWWF